LFGLYRRGSVLVNDALGVHQALLLGADSLAARNAAAAVGSRRPAAVLGRLVAVAAPATGLSAAATAAGRLGGGVTVLAGRGVRVSVRAPLARSCVLWIHSVPFCLMQ